MKSTKKKFKTMRDMHSFLDNIKKRNEDAIKRHDGEIKKYQDFLKKENLLAESSTSYKRRSMR